MKNGGDREFVEALLRRNRYLVLCTTDGTTPWAAPLEYMIDDDLNFYVFSTDDSRHIRHVERNDAVAVAVFDGNQPEYSSDGSIVLNGVQMEATVRRLSADDYNDAIAGAIEALNPPMPPYSVFKIEPNRCYIPRIENGVNVRTEISISPS